MICMILLDCVIFVSILVLMEVPLQQLIDCSEFVLEKGFNPCFNGSPSATRGVSTP